MARLLEAPRCVNSQQLMTSGAPEEGCFDQGMVSKMSSCAWFLWLPGFLEILESLVFCQRTAKGATSKNVKSVKNICR